MSVCHVVTVRLCLWADAPFLERRDGRTSKDGSVKVRGRPTAVVGWWVRFSWGEPVAAKDARERKRDFDKVMRNRGQRERPGEPERTPCVLYLCKEARQELALQRNADQLSGVKPLVDSAFVERAVLNQPRGAARSLPITNAAKQLAKARKSNEALLRKQQAHESELVKLQFKIEKLESQIAHKGAVALHGKGKFNPMFMRLHQAVRKELRAGHDQLAEARELHKLVGAYVTYLCR